MGMYNQRTHTGINSGELSEAVLAVHAVSRASGLSGSDVVGTLLGSDGRRIPVGGVTVSYDGKAETAFREVEKNIVEPSELYLELRRSAARVLGEVLPLTGNLSKVEVLGAGRGKCDVRLEGSSGSVALSLKYGHGAPTRRQSPKWGTMVEAYGLVGLDIGFFEREYAAAHRRFISGGLRNSRRKGDYSPELRAACDLMHATELSMWHGLADRMPHVFDPRKAAEGMISMYCGAEQDIHYVDMRDGTRQVVDRTQTQRVYEVLSAGPPTLTVGSTGTGGTNMLDLHVGGVHVFHAFSTVSTNAARKRGGDMRTPKPQTYFVPQLANLL